MPTPCQPADFDPVIEIHRPRSVRWPLVLGSPHSGRLYPPCFVNASRLDILGLRRSEDAWVDEILGKAAVGAPLLRACFPRAFLDVNRQPFELDPVMFDGPLPPQAISDTPRIAAGLGTIPRIVAEGVDIYAARLPASEAMARIENYYLPYHRALRELLEQARNRFGVALLIDGHSMPSRVTAHARQRRPDFILGDNHGKACDPAIWSTAEHFFRQKGFRVVRNTPYAGGYITRTYGTPEKGFHALQIEINRDLYMDEKTLEKNAGFDGLRSLFEQLATKLAAATSRLTPPEHQAAE